MKGWCYPEYVPMLHAARALQKPIHWVSTRSEAFVTDNQGRDSFWTAELALNKRGRFLGLRVDCLGNVGAYFTGVAHFVFTTHISGCLPTVYDIPHAQVNTRCVFTNTLPTGPYRGAGRPEASYLIERLIDAAADATGIDAAELRRRNLIAPDKIPYTTAFGNTYDSGDFPARVRARAGARRLRRLCRAQEGGEEGRQAARHRHRLLSGDRRRISGRSRAHYVSRRQGGQCQHRRRRQRAGAPDGVRPRGGAPARHRARGGDVSRRAIPRATCRASARSPRARRCMSAAPSRVTADKVIEKGKRVAAMLLQAAESDIDYRDGKFSVKDSGREVSLFDVAERAAELARSGVIPESLDTQATVKTPPSFPNGCHVAEVEIDPATGAVAIVSYVAVDDCGNVLDDDDRRRARSTAAWRRGSARR